MFTAPVQSTPSPNAVTAAKEFSRLRRQQSNLTSPKERISRGRPFDPLEGGYREFESRLQRRFSTPLQVHMDMENDTAVYDAMAYNTGTAAYDIWKGVATRAAIEAAGYRFEVATLKYCPKEKLEKDGWAYRV
jgi:hypothetical protein